MRVTRALLRRSAVQAGQLAAAALVAALGTGSVVALSAVPDAAVARGLATLVADAEPTAGALRVDTALARDGGEAQDERFRAALATGIGDAPLEVVRGVRSEPVTAVIAGVEHRVVLGAQEGLDTLADLVDGEWANGDEVMLSAPAARELGLGAGDAIAVLGESHRIAGVWAALDPADATWFGEALVASGRSGDAVGIVAVPEAVLQGLEVRPRVTWTLVPRVVSPDDLNALAPVEARVRASTSGLAAGTSFAVSVSGALTATVERAERAVAAARVLSATAVTLVVIASGIVLSLVGRALGQVRTAEWRLLVARGLSRPRAAALGLGESLVIVGVGTAVGVTAAALLAAAADAVVPPSALLAALAAGLAGVVLFAVAARSTPAEREGRGGTETDSFIPAVGVSVLAGFALVTAATVPSSPARDLAPALALVAGILVLRLLLAPIMRLAERLAARGTGLLPVLPLRQLGRRPRAVASAFLVVALGAGSVVIAGLAGGAVAHDDAASVRAAVGGDLRLSFTGVDRQPVVAAPFAGVEGVDAATGVALVDAQTGSTTTKLVVAGDEFAAVTGVAPPAADSTIDVRVAPALAARLGAVVGDEVPLSVPGVRSAVMVRIGEIAEVPGAGGAGMLVARDALAAALPADAVVLVVDEVWLASRTPEATAAAVRAASDRPVIVRTPATERTAAVTDAGALATAAAAALVVLIGVGGLAAAAAGIARVRRGELLPLRSLGVGPAAQARGRVVELLLTSLAGVLAGGVAGVLAARLAVGGSIAAADLASAMPLALAGLLALGVLVVCVGAGLAVRRQAGRDAGVRS